MEHASTADTNPPPVHGDPTARQWLSVLTATLLVAGCPVAAVWWLRESGLVSSALLAALLGLVLSLLASSLGAQVWERRPGSEDLLFSELMVWGFLHRRLTQRRLAATLEALAGQHPTGAATTAIDANARAKLLRGLVTRMEARDPYLHGHSRRVARHAWMIAKRMKLPAEEAARIRNAAALHDVGKVHTPTAILHKPGRLTDGEYAQVKLHPGDGASMVCPLGDPELTAMVRHHHERLDGSGYPDGLRAEDIPLGARIIAVADTFDAITSTRPYRSASPHRRALAILHEESGVRLDAAVVRAFCGHYAGRGPLALWSFAAALPERLVSWLLGSFASVASVAKVAAVAAIVGGAAVGSSSLAQQLLGTRGPSPAHVAAATHPAAADSALAGAHSRGAATGAAGPHAGLPGRGSHHRSHRGAGSHRSTATNAAAPPATRAVAQPGASGLSSGSGVGAASGEAHHGGGETGSGGGGSSGGSGSSGAGSGETAEAPTGRTGEAHPGEEAGAKHNGGVEGARGEEPRAREEPPHGTGEEAKPPTSEEARAGGEGAGREGEARPSTEAAAQSPGGPAARP